MRAGVPRGRHPASVHDRTVREDLRRIGVFNEYFLLDYFLIGPDKLHASCRMQAQTDDRVHRSSTKARACCRARRAGGNNFGQPAFRAAHPVTTYLSGPCLPDAAVFSRFYEATSHRTCRDSSFSCVTAMPRQEKASPRRGDSIPGIGTPMNSDCCSNKTYDTSLSLIVPYTTRQKGSGNRSALVWLLSWRVSFPAMKSFT